jgi:hypothetical protein
MKQINYEGQLINIDCDDHGDVEDDIMEDGDNKQDNIEIVNPTKDNLEDTIMDIWSHRNGE